MGVGDRRHEIRIGEATAVSCSSGNTVRYPVFTAERQVKLLEFGITIGHNTVQDDANPSTSYVKWGLEKRKSGSAATLVVAMTTLLGTGGSTQILPDAYTAMATVSSIDDLGNGTMSDADVLLARFDWTNQGANEGLHYATARLKYRPMD